MTVSRARAIVAALMLTATPASGQARLQSGDLLRLRSVSAVQLSPDATRVAYVVDSNDGPGRPYGQVFVMTIADGKWELFSKFDSLTLNSDGFESFPSLTPDGRIAIMSDTSAVQIYSIKWNRLSDSH